MPNAMTRAEAKILGVLHYNTGKPCVHGHIALRRVKDRVCTACDCVKQKALAVNDPIAFSLRKKASYKRNVAQHLATKRAYRQKNKGKINALVTARKRYIKQRTPKWVGPEELWLIQQAYELAATRTKLFGFPWHVDHIVPLQGKKVSGLHVPTNLRVIPGVENIRKRNSFEVDHA